MTPNSEDRFAGDAVARSAIEDSIEATSCGADACVPNRCGHKLINTCMHVRNQPCRRPGTRMRVDTCVCTLFPHRDCGLDIDRGGANSERDHGGRNLEEVVGGCTVDLVYEALFENRLPLGRVTYTIHNEAGERRVGKTTFWHRILGRRWRTCLEVSKDETSPLTV